MTITLKRQRLRLRQGWQNDGVADAYTYRQEQRTLCLSREKRDESIHTEKQIREKNTERVTKKSAGKKSTKKEERQPE